MRQRLLQHLSFAKPLRLALVLSTLLLTLPQTVWGVTEEVTKTITFNKDVSTVSSGINNSTMSVSINEQITGGASTSYDGVVNIQDAYSLLDSYSGTTTGGAVFNVKSTATYGNNNIFTIEIPGNYPAVPTQVTLKVGWENAKSSGQSTDIVAKIQVGDYDSGSNGGNVDPTVAAYANHHPFLSNQVSLQKFSDPLVYTANNQTGLGTNREVRKSFYIFVSLNGNDAAQTTFTIKEATITYNREAYGVNVAGIHVGDDNASNVLSENNSSISYNSGSNTLTLNGATINYTTDDVIVATNTSTLNVNLLGTNSISCGGHFAFNISNNLNFQSSGGVSPGQLTITSTSNIDPQSFYSGAGTVTYENDLAATSNGANSVIISCLGYELYIDGTRVTPGNASDILTGANAGKVSYNAADNILTLNGASLSKIRTEISGLKINLVGTNTIVASDSAAIQRYISSNNVSGSAITLSFNGTGNLTITKANSYPSINSHITVSYNDGLVSEDGTSTTRISKGYNLTIAGTTVTELNSPDVFGNSKVSFTPARSDNNNTNTLTLNGASISGTIESGLDGLTIEFIGVNSLTGSDGYITSSNNSAALKLKGVTNGTVTTSTLSLENSDPVHSAVGGFVSVTLNGAYLKATNCCKYISDNVREYKDPHNNIVQDLAFTTQPHYLLWIQDRQVSDGNKDDIFNDLQNNNPISATFAPSSSTLTLNGVQSSSQFGIESELDNLIISLIGDNTVHSAYHAGYNSIFSNNGSATLKIQNAGTADCSLDLKTYGSDPVIKGFQSVDYSGLNFVSKTGTTLDGASTTDALLSSATIYPLWVAGTMVTENASSGAGWSYDGNTNTLTLDGYTSSYNGHAFAINMPNLNVYLKGTNTVTFSGIAGSNAFYSSYNNNGEKATLTFSTDENNMGKLVASSYNIFSDGFKVTNGIYCNNGLGYYPSTCTIEAKKTPTIKFVERDQTNGNIPTNSSDYVYVAENGTIGINYVPIFYAPKPIFSDDYQLSDSTRYEYTMSVDGVVEFALGGTPSGKSGKIDYANDGKVYIHKSGTVTITCTFPGNMQNKACSASYTFKITRDFNNPFANQPAEQIYATYYNGDEDLTLPDGITAYVITGISGNTVTTTATGYLPHEVPILLEKTGNVGTTITGYTGSAGNFSSNLLKFADQTFSSTGKEYILYMNEFVKATGDIHGSRCYLDLSSVNPSRGMYGIGDGTTSIRELRMENEGRDEWYDLQGRRIEQPTKAGLYIKNGKKVIVNIK